MPVPSTVEGLRISVSDTTSTTVSFTQVHANLPGISITLEPTDDTSYTTARVSNITLTGATIQFSSRFSGYLHLHAFSVA
jgi:hypothetical protein